MYRQGEIVAVRMLSGIEHWGLSTEYRRVISCSKRTGLVAEEDEEIFSAGNPIVSRGYPSNLPGHEVVAKARKLLGRKWDLLAYNCQHFATEGHNQKQSPQLKIAVVILAVVGVVALMMRGKK